MNKRILIFTDSFPHGRGETFFEPELHHLSQLFERISILPLEKQGGKVRRNLPENTELLEAPLSNLKSRFSLLVKGIFNLSPVFIFKREGMASRVLFSPARFRRWFAHFLLTRYLLSFIRKNDLVSFFNRQDILYFYWGLRWSQILPFIPDLNPKTIVRFHGSDLYEHVNAGYIPWRKSQIQKIHFPVVVSETGKRYLMDVYRIPEKKIFLSRTGTCDYGLNPFNKGETIRLVSCSNLVPVKRVDLIAVALKHLTISAEWIHFGDGPCREKVIKTASGLPPGVSFRLAGHVNHEELTDYYRNTGITLFINVSSSEGVPVSVMEALSFGIPVIATDAGGTSEITGQGNGRIIPIDFDPPELARAIEIIALSDKYPGYRVNARKSWEENCMASKLMPSFGGFLLSV